MSQRYLHLPSLCAETVLGFILFVACAATAAVDLSYVLSCALTPLTYVAFRALGRGIMTFQVRTPRDRVVAWRDWTHDFYPRSPALEWAVLVACFAGWVVVVVLTAQRWFDAAPNTAAVYLSAVVIIIAPALILVGRREVSP